MFNRLIRNTNIPDYVPTLDDFEREYQILKKGEEHKVVRLLL